ncbi:MAG: hypothetical protein ACRC4S_01475, partial [Cetobacterium sp.]
LKKSFKWDIKSFKVEDNIPIVLIENNKQKEINIYKDSWLTIAESEKAEFNFEDIIDVYTENNILYFLTKNGVFKKDKSWTQVLNKIYQNGKFEKYNNKLAVVQENKVEYLDDKSENRVIENSAYYKNNSNEYYLKNGSLYTDSLKNTLALNLSNTYSSFNQNEKYYYLTTEGLAQYNLKNHTWNYQKNIFGVINSYEIIENNIFLNTRNGLFKIDLSTLKIEHYLQNKNIINSNLAYAIEDEIGVKKLYELKNNVYEKVNSENNDFKLTEIEAVDIKNENLRIYTKKDIFNYNENKNTLEKFSSNKIGDITNFGEYKEIRYLFNGEKIQVEDSDYNSKGYSKGENYFYFIDENGIYDFDKKSYLFNKLENVYSQNKEYYYTTNGSFKYDSRFGIYYKVDDETRDRLKVDNIYILRDNNEILIHNKNILENRLKINSEKLGFNINGELKVFLDGEAIKTFEKGEEIDSLKGIQNNKVYFETNIKKVYSYDLLNRQVKLSKGIEFKYSKEKLFKYNGNLRGIFFNGKEFIFLNEKGEKVTIEKDSYKLVEEVKPVIGLTKVNYSFTENGDIYISD